MGELPPNRHAWRRARRIVARVLCATVLCLLVAELALRAVAWARGWTSNCYAPQLNMYQADPKLGFGGLKPGYRVRTGVTAIDVNALGFRGPEIAPQKPSGTYRIFMVGGSSVFGYLVRNEETSSVLLQQLLDRRAPGRSVEVINAGVPGYNTMHTLVRFLYRIRPLEPDLLVYYQGFNDLGYITRIDDAAAQPQIFGGLGTPPLSQRVLGRSMLYGFLRYRSGMFVARPAPAASHSVTVPEKGLNIYEQNLRLLVDAARSAGTQIVICSQASLAHRNIGARERELLGAGHFGLSADGLLSAMESLRNIQRKVADDQAVPFVDLHEQIEPTLENFGDALHLTAKGQRRLAEALAVALTSAEILAGTAATK
jgi:lysophospholipase L1-like esterase